MVVSVATAIPDTGMSAREVGRLAMLRYLDAVRPDVDLVLQQIVDDVRIIFGTDLCMINLVLEDTQYFRAWSGTLPADLAAARQDPRERSMCQYVVATERPLVVHDFLATTEFQDQHFCLNYSIRFYAGVPLITSSDATLGSLCLLHTAPLPFDDAQLSILAAFARAVVARLELLGALTREQELNRAKDEMYAALNVSGQQEALRAAQALRKREQDYRALFEQANDAILIFDPDTEVVHDVNERACQLYGMVREQFVGTSLQALSQNALRGRGYIEELVAAGSYQNFESVHLNADSNPFTVLINASLIDFRGKPAILSINRDMTAWQQAEAALRASEARHRAIVDTAFDAIVTMSQDGLIQSFNRGAERIFGFAATEIIGQSLTLLMPERFRAVHTAGLGRYLATGHAQILGRTLEVQGQRKDGTEFPLELSLTHLDQEAGFAGILRDITERNAFEAQLRHQAFHDPLTGLPNRALFMERLDHALGQITRQGGACAVLFLDLDRFKVINDSLGHEQGDQLLILATERIQQCVRPGDTVARQGGDEFTILLEGVGDVNDAARVAERIGEALHAPFLLAGQAVFVSTSIGLAINRGNHYGANDIVRCADMAMYRAKNMGKARYEVYDPSMNALAVERLRLETDLRRALENGEFRLHYQPKVHVSGAIEGMEALVRWEHPQRGLVSPATFIPLAEETGLIIPLGRWVVLEACRQARQWHAQYPHEPPLSINVNLSGRQFQHPDLITDIAQALIETGINPHCLQLEITESILMEDAATNSTTLLRLKDLGVRLAIDDFGTGYSSLSYLKRFPVDTLKIDKSFVDGLGHNPEDTAIVRAVITLSHALGLGVTAEGVETPEQWALPQQLGCELGQGYYFAKPLPSHAADALLAQKVQEKRELLVV